MGEVKQHEARGSGCEEAGNVSGGEGVDAAEVPICSFLVVSVKILILTH